MYEHLWNCGIQYSEGKSYSSSLMERPEEDKTSFDSVVAVYAILPCGIFKPNSIFTKHRELKRGVTLTPQRQKRGWNRMG